MVLARVEMLLNNLARGTGRERVALGGKVSARNRLGDGRQLRGQNGDAFEATDGTAPTLDGKRRRRAIHLEYTQHIADAIDDRDCRFGAARLRFGDRLRDDLPYIGD